MFATSNCVSIIWFIHLGFRMHYVSGSKKKIEDGKAVQIRHWYHCFVITMYIDYQLGIKGIFVNFGVHFKSIDLKWTTRSTQMHYELFTRLYPFETGNSRQPVQQRISGWLPAVVAALMAQNGQITSTPPSSLSDTTGHSMQRWEWWQLRWPFRYWILYHNGIDQMFQITEAIS